MTNLTSAKDFRRFAELSGLAEKWEQKGRQEGVMEGLQKGMQRGMTQLLKFLKSGHSLEEAEVRFAMA